LDPLATLDHKDRRVLLEQPGHKDLQDQLDPLATLDHKDLKDPQVLQDHRDHKARRDLLDR